MVREGTSSTFRLSSCCECFPLYKTTNSEVTVLTSVSQASYYYHDYSEGTAKQVVKQRQLNRIEEGYTRAPNFAALAIRNRYRPSPALTESALSLVQDTKTLSAQPMDLNAIYPWLTSVQPMDPVTIEEMNELIRGYEEEYEEFEKSVTPVTRWKSGRKTEKRVTERNVRSHKSIVISDSNNSSHNSIRENAIRQNHIILDQQKSNLHKLTKYYSKPSATM